MIFTIKGTSGSGKTSLVRNIMDLYDSKSRYMIPNRKQPLGYICSRSNGQGKSLAVIGHYETACGGCDTINKVEHIFQLVKESRQQGFNVLYEGLLVAADVVRTAEIAKLWPEEMHVIALNTPLEVCLDSINDRRLENWKRKAEIATQLNKPVPANPGPVNPKNTISKFKGVQLCMQRLADQGVNTHWFNRDEAFNFVKEKLGL